MPGDEDGSVVRNRHEGKREPDSQTTQDRANEVEPFSIPPQSRTRTETGPKQIDGTGRPAGIECAFVAIGAVETLAAQQFG